MAKAEPFKNKINVNSIEKLGALFYKVDPSFAKQEFIQAAVKNLEEKELKARVIHIADKIHKFLPKNYSQAANQIQNLLAHLQKSLGDFDFWPLLTFVEKYGVDHREISLALLKRLTPHFSAEFAIRPYFDKYPKETLQEVLTWTKSSSVDIRRLASEGSRPRLPWGLQLKKFVNDPALTLPILEKLKYDDELYVRKSVANHLNDISKDHPDFALKVARSWLTRAPAKEKIKILWIVRHGLRGLIKKGNPKALQLLGFSHKAKIRCAKLKITKTKIKMPGKLEFQIQLISESSKAEKIVVDYIIHHQKASGKMTPKVFKLTHKTLKPQERLLLKSSHTLKPITTRKYYAGPHLLEILVNGKILAKQKWTLVL